MAHRLVHQTDRDRFEAFVGAVFSQADQHAVIADLAELEAPGSIPGPSQSVLRRTDVLSFGCDLSNLTTRTEV